MIVGMLVSKCGSLFDESFDSRISTEIL